MKQILFFLALFLASLPAVAQPTITQPPANQAVALGGTLTLGVMAGGAAPAYQWFKDSRLILGATNSTLTVLNAGVTNSGTYYVVVTNMGGMVISLPALVAVGSPSLSAWGYNSNGQLGNGTTSNTNLPIIVASNVVAGAGGNAYSLFVKTDGTLSAMGYNFFGQLGNGTSRDAHTPINVASNVVAVAAGQDHSLFVKTNGTLWAMGLNANGQLGNGTINNAYTPISVASNVVFVAAGYEHSLFVTADGTLWAMGLNLYGQLGNGTTSGLNPNPTPINVASNVVAAVAGDDDSLFVTTDGTLWAMGWNNVGQLGNGTTINTSLPVSVASNVVAVAAGQFHSLFETTDGTLCVMGRNNYGQLGNGTTNNSSLPVSVPQLSVANIFPVDQAYHSLAIGFSKTLATVMLLGNLNQTYTGSAISVTADTVPPGLTVNLTYNGSPNAPTNPGSYTVIGTISDPNYYGSAMNTLVINPNATVTLGNLNQAYTGSAVNVTASTTPPGLTVNLTYNGSTNEPTSPGSYTVIGAISTPNYYGVATNTLVITGPTVAPAGQVLAVGGAVTLGVTVSNMAPAYQWFKDSRLILGATNSTLTVLNAGVPNSGTYYVVITNGNGMAISLPASVAVGNPSLLAWGYNDRGQLGNGTTTDDYTPISVASNVVAGAAGGHHSLFVDTNGILWAMGWNASGQLGTGTTISTNLPVSVASNVVAVAAGLYHSLFVKTDGTLWAMGYNNSGQLGNGTTTDAHTPINVAINVVAAAAGYYHSLFVKSDGTLWAMGNNSYGELGNGTTSNTNLPVSVASNVVAVAAGYYHSLFVKTDGTLWAMGYNNYGQLGNGTTIYYTNWPVSVASNVVAVAAGGYHSLFVESDGTLWAMGMNILGQLGNGTTSNTNLPISVASNVVAVAAGASYSLFTKSDGTFWTMGYNFNGQLGSGTNNSVPNPTPINLPQLSVANIFPADTANHSLAMGFMKASAIVTLANLNQLYTGSAISVTASTTPPGLTVNLTYNGSLNAPTNAGSYTVVGTVTDPNYYGSATNTLVVGLPPQSFTAGSTNGQQLILQLAGTPGYPYILQMATNLTPPVVWQCVFTNCADTNGNCSFTITNLTVMPEGFYRAVGQ